MSALEFLNDNPKVFGGERRPIVEFAIEDKRKLQMQKELYERHAHKLLGDGKGGGKGDTVKGKDRRKKKEGFSRGRLQREKRRAKKAEGAAANEVKAKAKEQSKAKRIARQAEEAAEAAAKQN